MAGRRRGLAGPRILSLWLISLGTIPGVSLAQLSATPHAAVEVEHNTNVFDLSSSGGAPTGAHGATYGDTFVEARAGIDAAYLLGQQSFFAAAEFRRFEYNNFTTLSHNENKLAAGMNWRLDRIVDGLVDYSHEQRMVQFMDLAASTNLILETENKARATANVLVTPEWRWENRLTDRVLNSPRTDIPGLSLREDAIHEGVRYLGLANLAAGVDAEYLTGKYRNDPIALNPSYHQITVQLAAKYVISGLTNFNGALGYTSRDDKSNLGSQSAVTGALGYKRNLTGKTSIDLELSRAVNSYLTSGGNELDTTASASVLWQATYKASVRLGYAFTNSNFSQSAGFGQASRVDHLQTANAEVNYVLLHWLSVRGYTRYQTRGSTQDAFRFNGTVYGIELVAQPPAHPPGLKR